VREAKEGARNCPGHLLPRDSSGRNDCTQTQGVYHCLRAHDKACNTSGIIRTSSGSPAEIRSSSAAFLSYSCTPTQLLSLYLVEEISRCLCCYGYSPTMGGGCVCTAGRGKGVKRVEGQSRLRAFRGSINNRPFLPSSSRSFIITYSPIRPRRKDPTEPRARLRQTPRSLDIGPSPKAEEKKRTRIGRSPCC
jgi:hypothetical protein